MRILLIILGTITAATIVATDPWWTDTLPGISMLLLLVAVVGGICWIDGYQRGKS